MDKVDTTSLFKREARQERQKMTAELRVELDDTFELLADGSNTFSPERLLVGLKALGIEPSESSIQRSTSSGDITQDEWIIIVAPYLSQPGWILTEMQEAMLLFDQDNNGSIDAIEVTQVFVKLGEKITKQQVQDQISAWSQVEGMLSTEEFFHMILDKESIPTDDMQS